MLRSDPRLQKPSYAAAASRRGAAANVSRRPLPRETLGFYADEVVALRSAHDALAGLLFQADISTPASRSAKRISAPSVSTAVDVASDARAASAASTGGARQICFDVSRGHAMQSAELLRLLKPKDCFEATPLVAARVGRGLENQAAETARTPVVSDESASLLHLLPADLAAELRPLRRKLTDINLDKGRRPHCWVDGKRHFLGNSGERLVISTDLDHVVKSLGGFRGDNRAGLERELHRISAIRNRGEDVIGLTMRVGRHISGNAAIIADILFQDASKSILFLGEPGSGKTTVVREATRLLADRYNVVIVDTSNEIAGDGDVPHPCVGHARRMMVPSLQAQAAVMTECIQNHTPEVIVIDEIGRPNEVEAARTCKQRGARLVASAHGDLRKLVKNGQLNGLVGGIMSVTLGDVEAKAEASRHGDDVPSKLKAQRAGAPVFDVIVELRRGAKRRRRRKSHARIPHDASLDAGAATETAGAAYDPSPTRALSTGPRTAPRTGLQMTRRRPLEGPWTGAEESEAGAHSKGDARGRPLDAPPAQARRTTGA